MTEKEIMEQAKNGSINWEDIKKREGLDTGMEKLEKMVRKLEDDTISRQATITEIKNYERDSTAPIDYVKIVEQMPPAQPDARYINANELIKRLQQAGLDDAVSIAVKMAGHERLKHVPSAQPECKKGKWMPYDQRFPWSNNYKCSECGNYLNFSGVNGGRGDANFCPKCGADMR